MSGSPQLDITGIIGAGGEGWVGARTSVSSRTSSTGPSARLRLSPGSTSRRHGPAKFSKHQLVTHTAGRWRRIDLTHPDLAVIVRFVCEPHGDRAPVRLKGLPERRAKPDW